MATNDLAALLRNIVTEAGKSATEAHGSVRDAILEARSAMPAPTHTRDELSALTRDTGLVGRIAKGMLRIGFTAIYSTGNPQLNPSVLLPQMAAKFYDDPLGFVMFAFDWDTDPSLRVVKLPADYQFMYESSHGPDLWACRLLEQIAESVRARAFNGREAVTAIRHATASGHGIGKSAFTAWVVNWIMTTRPNARGVITANTASQLETKTWAEVGKWTKRSAFTSWFDVSAGKGSMRMVMREFPEAWRCDAQTSREENSESFAGLHAADSTPFYIFDEASAIPHAIWEVAEGGMTDGEPHFYAFGNPTRGSGRFFECFNAQRHRWAIAQIDSRTVQVTNKAQIDEWIADYGIDSDFVKVRVLGTFPSASDMQFIARSLVDEARRRGAPSERLEAIVVGVDPARFGDDSSVIYTRCGRDGRGFPIIRLRGVDTMTLASRTAEHVNLLRSQGRRVILAIDGGGVGGGVIDRLRLMGFDVEEVQFGGKALDPRKYKNRRAEIWGLMRDWLKTGCLPDDESLATDLCSIEYGYDAADAIVLESKQSMKARGLASPDAGDALAVTFALPTMASHPDLESFDRPKRSHDYDPFASIDPNRNRSRDFNPYIRV